MRNALLCYGVRIISLPRIGRRYYDRLAESEALGALFLPFLRREKDAVRVNVARAIGDARAASPFAPPCPWPECGMPRERSCRTAVALGWDQFCAAHVKRAERSRHGRRVDTDAPIRPAVYRASVKAEEASCPERRGPRALQRRKPNAYPLDDPRCRT